MKRLFENIKKGNRDMDVKYMAGQQTVTNAAIKAPCQTQEANIKDQQMPNEVGL